ncbi:MAG: mandelate racemase/muconate lactonizing enzyme family protein [Dehalococcoidia bacterium]|nr:mandelate racemase/muconate lactonizing enzyme family protein [Dehalococcoidia bacterium]
MPAPAKSRIKVTDVKVIPLKVVREVGAIEPAWAIGNKMHVQVGGGSFTEIQTDAGITGIGPGMDPQLAAGVKTYLLGKDPFDIEQHSSALRYFVHGAPYRGTAGADIALWDIIGKASGQPLYKLWGGGRDKVIPYASMVLLGTPEERAALAQKLLSEGWKAIKLRLHHETMKEDLRTVEVVRKAVGDRMTIMVDGNQAQSNGSWQPGVRWDFRRAVETARGLQEMGVYWLEEPLPRYAFDQLAELSKRVEIPISGGENNPRLDEFILMLEKGVYDILQPESMVLDGVTALRKIGVLAELHNKKIVPHHGGGNIGVIAHLHLVASWAHAPFLELLNDPPIGDYRHRFSIMANPPLVDRDGYLAVPQGPGLGVEIDRSLIAT